MLLEHYFPFTRNETFFKPEFIIYFCTRFQIPDPLAIQKVLPITPEYESSVGPTFHGL